LQRGLQTTAEDAEGKSQIGTWNVRTFNQGGKLENLLKEMQKNAVSEVSR
jgi:hypothetical protein